VSEPAYRKIANDLRQQIASGTLPPGSKLPTEIELQEIFGGASRNTIRDAIKLLAARGLVEARPGQGTFVVEKILPFTTVLTAAKGFGGEGSAAYAQEVGARHRQARVSPPRVEIQLASAAPELELASDEDVISRHQQRYIDDKPWSLQTTFYPKRFADQGAELLTKAADIPHGAVAYLQRQLGVTELFYRDLLFVRPPDMTETEFFKISADRGVAVFEIRRTGYGSGGPLRLTVTTYPTDRNRFVMMVGDVPAAANIPQDYVPAELKGGA
jgi:GntR family transcriptional regulator